MNERIQQLAEQARASVPPGLVVEEWIQVYNQVLGELIVQECAGLFPNVYVEIENEYGHTPVIAADYIKKHFGIEV